MNLKEYLASKPDAHEKDIELVESGVTVRIRRITVGERKRLYTTHKINTDKADLNGLTAELLAISVVPPLTLDEVENMPAQVSDAIIAQINEFNGWSKKGVAELADQF